MKFKSFIGIDVSKSTLDVYLRNGGFHAVFSNNVDGFETMLEWIMEISGKVLHDELLAGFENTGIYSENLISYLGRNNIPFTVIPGLELKRSMGIKRGKSDKADARSIAEYIYEKKEKVKLSSPSSRTLETLKRLASYRERLVKERAAFKARLGEFEEVFPDAEYGVYQESHKHMMECMDCEIDRVEKEIQRLIKKDGELSVLYELVTSVKGIGPQTAIMMIIITQGFSLFDNWRKFASYAGIAPFPNQSGTFRGQTKTSKLANKRIKSLLTMCAATAIQHSPEMKLYYEKRISEGKNKMSTLNIIRNKLVSRIFAVVGRSTPYVDVLKYAA